MKTKIERELGGLRSDRKKVVERMDSYIQVEHMGQYTVIPLTQKEKEEFTKRDLVVGAVAFGAGYIAGNSDKKKKEPEKEKSLMDEIAEDIEKDKESEEQ